MSSRPELHTLVDDPVAKRMLGNFPQAFSHIGLIATALNLARYEGPAEERSDRTGS